jgi:hypothetical protein
MREMRCFLFELYSLRASKAIGFWHCVLCFDIVETLAEQPALARLKASFQTRFAWLSAPPLRDGAIAANLSFSAKKRKPRNTLKGIPRFLLYNKLLFEQREKSYISTFSLFTITYYFRQKSTRN